MERKGRWLWLLLIGGLLLAACAGAGSPAGRSSASQRGSSNDSSSSAAQSLPTVDPAAEIVTLLPKDAIPSIDNPQFYEVPAADEEYEDSEEVIGVEIEGEARAYSAGFLSSHEIVNDQIKGRPIAVTW